MTKKIFGKTPVDRLMNWIIFGEKAVEDSKNENGEDAETISCPEGGGIYLKGEDARVDAGMKCGLCAYGRGCNDGQRMQVRDLDIHDIQENEPEIGGHVEENPNFTKPEERLD